MLEAGNHRRAIDALGADDADNAARRAFDPRPGDGADDIGAGDEAQVGVDFFQFDAIAVDLDLVVDAAEAVEGSRSVADCLVAGQIPAFAGMNGKAGGGQFRRAEIAGGELDASDGQFSRRTVGDRLPLGVEHGGFAAG